MRPILPIGSQEREDELVACLEALDSADPRDYRGLCRLQARVDVIRPHGWNRDFVYRSVSAVRKEARHRRA